MESADIGNKTGFLRLGHIFVLFSWIIANNSLPFYCIPTKHGTKMCLKIPLLCAKF